MLILTGLGWPSSLFHPMRTFGLGIRLCEIVAMAGEGGFTIAIILVVVPIMQAIMLFFFDYLCYCYNYTDFDSTLVFVSSINIADIIYLVKKNNNREQLCLFVNYNSVLILLSGM